MQLYILMLFSLSLSFHVCISLFFLALSKKEAQVNSGIIIRAACKIVFRRKAKTPGFNANPWEEAKVGVAVEIKEVITNAGAPCKFVKAA